MIEKVYLVRVNCHDEKRNLIGDFFNKNQIAILVDQELELEAWDNYKKTRKSNIKKQFIEYWFKIVDYVEKNDVIILTTYMNHKVAKIGVIKKGSKYEELNGTGYKIFQLENVRDFNLSEYPILSSVIPMQATISNIVKKRKFILALYYNKLDSIEVSLDNMSDKLIELMCLEWLRSDLAKKFRIKYQLLLAGGNFANIDIIGISESGLKIVAQVTSSDNKNTIKKKIEKLSGFSSDIKIMFSNGIIKGDYSNENVTLIHLDKVFNDLNENGYSEMLEKFVRS